MKKHITIHKCALKLHKKLPQMTALTIFIKNSKNFEAFILDTALKL